jgi:gluconolactonase
MADAVAGAAVNRLELVAETDAHEGPVYAADEDALYFTTVRTDRVAIKRLSLADSSIEVVRADANMANGMTLDRAGRLVVCEQGTFSQPARITRLDRTSGAIDVVVEGALSSPNDVVVGSDGAVWFTDPTYGFLQGFRPQPEHPDRVYRFAAGALEVVTEAIDKPNGIALSPDERTLYVSDNGAPHHIVAFDLVAGTSRVVAVGTPEHPDGLKVDGDGRIYASAQHGVQVFAPDGELLDEIHLPGAVNFAFGDGRLFITTDTAVWAAELKGATS